ncbi:MAG TPA: GNAT family N-acetyltransferase [Clostridia bacterium]|nr:GNAT family N-acetyltransferase [Clostridia bacterium]
MPIVYRNDVRPPAQIIAALYRSSPLFRPVDDLARIARMYATSNVVLTAFDGERLVGILRGWTDGAFDGYVCDLAVAADMQKAGIGRELLKLATAMHPEIQWVLRASKIAAEYYAHIGWQKIENGWFWPREN